MAYDPFGPVGQQVMASSQGVVIASNQSPVSVTGTVSIGNFPVSAGSVVAFQGTTPWVTSQNGSIAAVIIGGSVAATFTPPANQSVSGTVGASIIGLTPVSITFPTNPSVSGTVNVGNFPTTQNVSGSVVASGTVGASVIGTVPVTQAGAFFVSGSVITVGTAAANQSVSGTVGASLIGLSPVSVSNFPVTQNVSGSVVAFQGAGWSGSVAATVTNFPTTQNVSGSVVAFVSGTPNVNAAGSVVAFQGTSPWVVQSIVGTYAEDAAHTSADKGIFTLGVRNDAVASFASANLEYGPIGTDSAGRTLTKPFSAEESRVEGYNSVVSTSVTTLVAAAGTGLKTYITDIVLVNTGAATTLVTFRSGGGTSVLGYGIAPAGGGSNMIGFATPMRTLANETFDFQATTSSSILFAKVSGFKAP